MTIIQLLVLAGIFMLITIFNLKLAIWYIERKQAKKAFENYKGSQVNEKTKLSPISFLLSEIKCVDSIEKNIDSYLDALTSNEMEKVGIMKEDALVAVIIPIKVYEKLQQSQCVSSQEEQP